MYKVLLFAGTTEGREMAEFLDRQNVSTYACVTTEYGGELLPASDNIRVSHERLDEKAMEKLMEEIKPELVIDGTHPYAAEATENIAEACGKTNMEYVRLLRGGNTSCKSAGCIYVKDVDEAVDFLSETEGNILVTTGSKEIAKYTRIPDYRNRVFARVLSLPKVAETCSGYGFEGRNLICMQGPFSEEMNAAMLKQYDCRYMVTKVTGAAGGFQEKMDAAEKTGVQAVVVGRPLEEEGLAPSECRKKVCEKFGLKPVQKISLVGIGMGSRDSMTEEALKAFEEADVVIGARRMTDAVRRPGQDVFTEYDSVKIRKFIDENPEYEKIAVALSGDTGFYSGTKKLLEVLGGHDVNVVSGISSVVYFTGKIKKSWDDVYITSSHGREGNLFNAVKTHAKVFSILGRKDDVKELALKLQKYGMNGVTFYIGENLSYADEKIVKGKSAEFTEYEGNPLSVIYMENSEYEETPATHGIRDEEFIRGRVPMTKAEVRSVSLAKMGLSEHSVCWDVGAGTGSVSVEMALRAVSGRVYAVERKPEAAELLEKNKLKFKADNLIIVEGEAPEALRDLPAPTHAFIGGSSGNMKAILELLFEKNPEVRVVINCIAMETAAEVLNCIRTFDVHDTDIVQLSVGRAEEIGKYHLMKGENPITVISFTGGE